MAYPGWENFDPMVRAIAMQKPVKRSKYGAQPTEVDGIRFHSKKEAGRYCLLKLREKAGEIHGLDLQPRFPLVVSDGHGHAVLGEYRADFRYCECHRGAKCESTRVVVEDVKGFKTPLYRWKKRHVEAQYGITVLEV